MVTTNHLRTMVQLIAGTTKVDSKVKVRGKEPKKISGRGLSSFKASQDKASF